MLISTASPPPSPGTLTDRGWPPNTSLLRASSVVSELSVDNVLERKTLVRQLGIHALTPAEFLFHLLHPGIDFIHDYNDLGFSISASFHRNFQGAILPESSGYYLFTFLGKLTKS